jgi:sulfatase modifying factor 1
MNSSVPRSVALAVLILAGLTRSARAESVASPFLPTVENKTPAPGPAPAGMVWIPGGEFSMGSVAPTDSGYCTAATMNAVVDAKPIHRVYVDGFWMDQNDVTNDEFAKFVAATGFKTIAEITPTKEEFPDAPVENLVAGSTVFTPTPGKVALDDYFQWWSYVHGADWRHPTGPNSNIEGRGNYPVVQIAYADAVAYALWAGKRLPTEAEWEFAARGGLSGQLFAWGSDLNPSGKWMANIYEGTFPVKDTGLDGCTGLAPIAQFPANGYGLYDMAGNVWQWISDWYRPDTFTRQLLAAGGPLAVIRNPTGPSASYDPAHPNEKTRVHRGGSFLCTDQYCMRYMVGTRGKGDIHTASNHLGFRCVQPVSQTAKAN